MGTPHDEGQWPLSDCWQVLENTARAHPDTLAVVDCGRDALLSYGSLYSRAAALASFLASQGVGRGSRVAVASRNSLGVMEAHFAAAALHAVVVNLNVHLAPPELAFILQNSEPNALVVDVSLAETVLRGVALARRADDAGGEAPLPAADLPLLWLNVDGKVDVAETLDLDPELVSGIKVCVGGGVLGGVEWETALAFSGAEKVYDGLAGLPCRPMVALYYQNSAEFKLSLWNLPLI